MAYSAPLARDNGEVSAGLATTTEQPGEEAATARSPRQLDELAEPRLRPHLEQTAVDVDDLLGAAASAKFQYGGQSAFTGYSLPIYGWNYYLQRFDPGQKMLTTGNADEVVDAETFWSRRAAAGLSGIGWDGGFNSRQGTPRFGSDNQMGPYDDYNYGSTGLGCGGSCGGCSGCGMGRSTVYGSHPLS